MGLNLGLALVLARAVNREKQPLRRVLTVGRLDLTLSSAQAQDVLGVHRGRSVAESFVQQRFADDFIKALCMADSVESVDVSKHENCTIQADLNVDIDPRLHGSFDLVIDGGTLEHIYNAPVAIRTYMNLVRQGGSIIIATVANNQLGHGFYQFSPEFFFRTFSVENGFEVRDMFLVKHQFPSMGLSPRVKFYRVIDPALIGKRVGLCSRTPVALVMHAVRIGDNTVAELRPIQSDYKARYEGSGARTNHESNRLKAVLRKGLPGPIHSWLAGWSELYRYSFLNKEFFVKSELK